ncbi:MAG: hypothetical protein JWP13_815 [Candidatus Saccharibacteria bacterium]|nr:hypothetical protein [Candidatus Saccharibacteria bacterium]
MITERFTLSAAVYLLLIKDNKVLLLRRYNTGWADGMYSMVSGHVDGGEPLSVAMCREAKEEAGITIAPGDIEFLHVMHRMSNKEYIDFFFMARNWEGEPYNAEPEKCDDMQWFPLDKLPDNILPHVRQVIAGYKKGLPFSEIGW